HVRVTDVYDVSLSKQADVSPQPPPRSQGRAQGWETVNANPIVDVAFRQTASARAEARSSLCCRAGDDVNPVPHRQQCFRKFVDVFLDAADCRPVAMNKEHNLHTTAGLYADYELRITN
ncbi:MAG: hypothetical protein V3V49_01140, partial [Candidatus Krumholzibacteria bacterium]